MKDSQTRMPVLFIAHGSPDILLQRDPVLELWRREAGILSRPQRILLLSAHWETADFIVGGNRDRQTLHDFSGFPEALYACQYRPPADEEWAAQLAGLLGCGLDQRRGLDHAVWVPLTVMFPQQDIPVTQLSVAPALGAAAHRALGRRLVALRGSGVLIIASGVIVHNLSRLHWTDGNTRPEGWAESFMAAVNEAVLSGDGEALQAWHSLPGAALAVPTPEHFLPLLMAQAAADGDPPRLFADQWRYGNLSQHCFRWG